jgi:hypothetical protein
MAPLPPIVFILIAKMILVLYARYGGYLAFLPAWNARVVGFVSGAFVGYVLLRLRGLIP